ncbi:MULTISPECIES: hypothetical protein [Arsenicicoccus]|uniref:hypothetical protein n=1 Tax=Arsenicicoccus TaxID=267408 RepID=UPI00257A2899|nr:MULTISPECIES: hypothetical protein [Arsenicicoccus]
MTPHLATAPATRATVHEPSAWLRQQLATTRRGITTGTTSACHPGRPLIVAAWDPNHAWCRHCATTAPPPPNEHACDRCGLATPTTTGILAAATPRLTLAAGLCRRCLKREAPSR